MYYLSPNTNHKIIAKCTTTPDVPIQVYVGSKELSSVYKRVTDIRSAAFELEDDSEVTILQGVETGGLAIQTLVFYNPDDEERIVELFFDDGEKQVKIATFHLEESYSGSVSGGGILQQYDERGNPISPIVPG